MSSFCWIKCLVTAVRETHGFYSWLWVLVSSFVLKVSHQWPCLHENLIWLGRVNLQYCYRMGCSLLQPQFLILTDKTAGLWHKNLTLCSFTNDMELWETLSVTCCCIYPSISLCYSHPAYSAPGTPPANRSSFIGVTTRDPSGLYQTQVSVGSVDFTKPMIGGSVDFTKARLVGVKQH